MTLGSGVDHHAQVQGQVQAGPEPDAPPPVLVLPPVPLPPAPERSPRTGGNAGAALAVLGLLLGAVLLSLGILAVLLLLTWVTRSFIVGFIALAFLVQLGRAFALFVRPPRGELPGVLLEPGEEPALEAFVQDLAQRMGTKPPQEISLIVDVNAMVTEVGPFLGLLPGTRRMAVSISLFDALDVSQLRAVLAHELGHLAGRHGRLGVLTGKIEQALVMVILSTGPRSLLGRLYVGYWRLHRRVGASVRRRNELAADLAAVRVAGRQSMADALRTIEVADHVESCLRGAYLVPLLRDHELPWDVQFGFWSVATDPWRLKACTEDPEPVEPHPWDSHPPTEERIRRVGLLSDLPDTPAHDGRAARILLKDANDLAERVRVAWAQAVVGDVPLRRVTWEEGMARTEAAWAAEASGQVDDILLRMGMSPGLRGVYETHEAGRDRELVSRLVAAGWRTGATDEWQVVLRTVLVVMGARDAVAVGTHAYHLSWSASVGVVDAAGEEAPLRGWVEQAMAGDWRPLVQGLGLDRNAVPAPTTTPGGGPKVRMVSDPPSPPFARGRGEWSWEAALPGGLLRRHPRVRIADAGIGLDDGVLRWDQIEHVALAYRRQGRGATAVLTLVDAGGRRARTRLAGASAEDGARVSVTAAYLWDLLSHRTGERLAEEAMLRIAEGEEVEAGGLVFSRAGLAAARRRNDVVPWAEVRDAQPDGRGMVVPRKGGKPLKADANAQDAVLLGRLIPQARALLA